MTHMPILRGLLAGLVLGTRRAMAQVRIRAGEVASNVELFLPYGMSASPVPGKTADMIVLAVGGTRDHLVAILDDSSLRIADLQPGEFGFKDANGNLFIFRTNQLQVVAPNGLNITGDVTVTGTLTATVDVIGGGKHLKTHTHAGVTTGSGNTGAPV